MFPLLSIPSLTCYALLVRRRTSLKPAWSSKQPASMCFGALFCKSSELAKESIMWRWTTPPHGETLHATFQRTALLDCYPFWTPSTELALADGMSHLGQFMPTLDTLAALTSIYVQWCPWRRLCWYRIPGSMHMYHQGIYAQLSFSAPSPHFLYSSVKNSSSNEERQKCTENSMNRTGSLFPEMPSQEHFTDVIQLHVPQQTKLDI